MSIEKYKNYVKQRLFLGNALTREAGAYFAHHG